MNNQANAANIVIIVCGFILAILFATIKNKNIKWSLASLPIFALSISIFVIIEDLYIEWKYTNKIIPGKYSTNTSAVLTLEENNTYSFSINKQIIKHGTWKYRYVYDPSIILTDELGDHRMFFKISENGDLNICCGSNGIKITPDQILISAFKR